MTTTLQSDARSPESKHLRILLICTIIFLASIGTRLMHWQDNRAMLPIFAVGMAGEYKANANLLLNNDVSSFLSGLPSPQDTDILAHPPGYPILIALVFKMFGSSDAVMQFANIACDAAAAILIFFIAAETISKAVGIIAGLLVAFSPQLAFHSIMILPESPAVLPILIAIYLIIRASEKPRIVTIIAAGAFIGLSCWLRANGLLLAPFLTVLMLVLFERGKRLRYSLALVGAAFIVIAPITIRNFMVFHHFIPISLGAGITMLEGIADYDKEARFGLHTTDREVIIAESKLYNRPDYVKGLFYPDGIDRERMRIARSLAVIRPHPVWFLGVMLRRATMMLRHERVPIVAAQPAITHSIEVAENLQPVWSRSPAEWTMNDVAAMPQSKVSLASEDQKLRITDDEAGGEKPITSLLINVQENTDYILRLPLKVEEGSFVVKVMSADRNNLLSATRILQPEPGFTIEDQPTWIIRVPFVSRDTNQVRVIFMDGKAKSKRIVVQLGAVELFAVGTASALWTRYPRGLMQAIQKIFLTAWMLPLAVIGIILLMLKGLGRVAVALLVVPAYYLCFQSILHTEYRYVVGVHYFLYIPIAVALYWLGEMLWQNARKLTGRVRLNSDAT